MSALREARDQAMRFTAGYCEEMAALIRMGPCTKADRAVAAVWERVAKSKRRKEENEAVDGR